MNTIADYIIAEIELLSNPEKARWQENYVKHNTKAYGVGIPDIRKVVKQAERKYTIRKLSDDTQFAFLDSFIIEGDETAA